MKAVLMALVLVLALSVAATAAGLPKVKVETTAGNFVIELDSRNAPKTVRNFVVYVKSGFYDGTIFHRVIPGFVIQGGGFDERMNQKPTRDPIQNEAANGLKNKQYTLSMARTPDPHSATSQFFINLVDNPSLDYRSSTPSGYGYAVFGRVVEGTEVIDRIAGVPTGRHGVHSDVPLTPVVIKKIIPIN